MDKDSLFKQLKLDHPDWSDDQIWTQISVMLSAADAVSEQGANASLTEDLLRLVLVKAKDWLLKTLPDIFEKVVTFFDDLLEDLPDWAKKGLSYVFKMIIRYYSGGGDYYAE